MQPVLGARLVSSPVVLDANGRNASRLPDAQPFQQPARMGLLFGRVIDGSTGQPIEAAEVVVSGLNDPRRWTDSEGRFAYFDVPPGSYRITAAKAGYALGEFGRQWVAANGPFVRAYDPHDSVQRIPLAPGERRGDLEVMLWRLSVISGRVLDDGGQPVVGATVQAWPRVYAAGRAWFNSVAPVSAHTDDRGMYRIAEVLQGAYVVVVRASSITTPASWQPQSSRILEWHPDVFVSQQTYARIQSYESVFPAPGRSSGMAEGDWVLASLGQPVLPGSADVVYPTMFFPAAFSAADAEVVAVAAGQERSGLDFALQPQPAAEVGGLLMGPEGPVGGVGLRLIQSQSGDVRSDFVVALAISDRSGRFVFRAVPVGQYRLEVHEFPRWGGPSVSRPRGASDGVGLTRWPTDPWSERPTLWAFESLSVSAQGRHDLHVVLRQGARIAGVVRFVGTSPPPVARDLERILELDRPDGVPRLLAADGEVIVAPDQRFRSIELPPGAYYVRAPRPPSGWRLRSVVFQGRDVSVVPLELGAESVDGLEATFVDRTSALSGTVRGPSGDVDRQATVVMFPANDPSPVDYGSSPRHIIRSRPAIDGQYVVEGMPPGEYWIVAINDRAIADWQNPDLFRALSRIAERIRIAEGETRRFDLRTRDIRSP